MKYIFMLFILIITFVFAIGIKTYCSINHALSYYKNPSQGKPSPDQIKTDFNQLFSEKQNRSPAALRNNIFLETKEYREINEKKFKEELKIYRERLDELKHLSIQSLDCNEYDMCVQELRNQFFLSEQHFVNEEGKRLSPESSTFSEEAIELYNQKLNELKEIFPEKV